jgi:hypothetical protein
MQYVCDAPPKTWFRIETEGEAALESRAMNHAVEKYFKQAYEQATKSYVPPRAAPYIEQNIGLKGHIQRGSSSASTTPIRISSTARPFASLRGTMA